MFITFSSIFLFFVYLKWKHPFWFIQPVYHYYDVFLWKTKEIRRELPEKNKFFNSQIYFSKIESLEEPQWREFQKLIETNFLRNGDNVFSPTLNEIKPYFIGHNNPSFISFMYANNYKFLNSETKTEKKVIGAITSRPITFQKKTIYYVDYLCIDKEERNKRLTPQLIQTHEYHQSHNSKSQISFFRREGNVPLLVPFVKFNCTIFSMIYWLEVKDSHKILRVNTNTIHMFNDFLVKQDAIVSDIGNILELVKTNNIMIYMCITGSDVNSCYFFRKSCTTIEGKEMLTLYASLNKTDNDTFLHLFKCSLTMVMKNEKYVYLCVEELGDNILIADKLSEKTHPERIPCGYYFYNYVHPTVHAKKCCILI